MFVVSLVLLASVTMPVAASEHTVELQSGNSYWYGQLLEYNDTAVNSGDNWTLRGVTSGNSTTVSASQDGTVTFDPTNLATDSANLQAEDIELVNPSGTVVLTASIDFQTLTPQSFTNDPVYDAGADTTTSIDIDSNRSNYAYDILITETSGKLTGSEIAGLSSNLSQLDSSTAQYEGASGTTTINMDFDGINPDNYEFEFATEHAVERDGAGGLQAVAGTQTITVQDATGSVEGSVSTEDDSYSGDISIELQDQNSTNTISQTVSGPSSSYTFNDVPVSTYDVVLNANNHESVTIQDVSVVRDSTASVSSTTLPLKDTVVSVQVDVDTLDGNTYDRELDVTLADSNGNVVGEQSVPDGTSADFTVDSTGEYTAVVNDRFVEETTGTVNVTSLGNTYTTTVTPLEQERGTLEVTADTENTVEEIRVNASNNSADRSRTFRISGSSGTVSGELLTGDYDITVDAIGHDPATDTVTISNGATTTRSYSLQQTDLEAQDGGQYWVGQRMDFSQYVSSGDSVRFRNRDTNEVYQPAISDASDFVVDTNNIQSAAGTGEFVFSVNDSPTIDFTLSEQNLDASFTSSVQLGGDLESSFTVSSERTSNQTIIITGIVGPSGTEYNGSRAAELNGQWDTNGTEAFTTVSSNEAFFTFDMSQATFNLEEGDYVFTTEVADTGATSDATLTVESDDTTDVSNLVSDSTIQEDGLYWTGQVLSLPSSQVDSNTTYRILKDDSLVQELSPRSSDGKLIFDTSWSDYGAGDYSIEDSSGNVVISNFLVRDQELSAEFDSDTVLNTGVQTESNATFESNRSTYPVIVELEEGPTELTASQIANRVESADLIDIQQDGETVTKAVINSAGSGEELVDFEELEEGSYTFKFDVKDSTASATASIDVSGLEEGTPEFSSKNYEANQGDVAEFDVVMAPGVDEATLLIGNADTGYYAELTLTDPNPNNSSIATVQMDTTFAGQGEPDRTFSVVSSSGEDSDSEEETTSSVQLQVVSETEVETDATLAPSRYLLQLETDGNEQDISALEIKALNAEMQGVYVIPKTTTMEELKEKANGGGGDDEDSSSDGSSGDGEDVEQATQPFFGDNDPVADGEIPSPSTGIVAIKLDGLGSQLYQDGLNASDFQEGSAAVDDTGAYIEIKQTGDDKRNRAVEDIPVSSLDYEYDQETGYIYFIIQPSIIEEAKAGQSFEFNFTIDERNPSIDEDNPAVDEENRDPIELSRDIRISESAIDWGMDPLEAEPESGQPFTAQTVYTPGTELNMVLLSFDTAFPYFESTTVEVGEDGRAIGTYDLNGAPLETEMQIELRNIADPQDVIVVDDAERPDFAETKYPQETTLTVNLEDSSGSGIEGTVLAGEETKRGSSVEFTVPTESTITVDGRADGYRPATKDVDIERSEVSTTLTLESAQDEEEESENEEEEESTYQVSVTVLDQNDEPIEGATVGFGERTRKTGSDGTMSIALTSGTYNASVSAEGYSEVSQELSIDSDNSYELTLEPAEDEEGSEGGSEDGSDGDGSESGSEDGSTGGESSDGSSSDGENGDSVRSEGQNGFGVIIALIAVGAVFVARKVRN